MMYGLMNAAWILTSVLYFLIALAFLIFSIIGLVRSESKGLFIIMLISAAFLTLSGLLNLLSFIATLRMPGLFTQLFELLGIAGLTITAAILAFREP